VNFSFPSPPPLTHFFFGLISYWADKFLTLIYHHEFHIFDPLGLFHLIIFSYPLFSDIVSSFLYILVFYFIHLYIVLAETQKPVLATKA
jgi:hypothetical protein